MQEILIDGMIRKLWVCETELYCGHLLRLDTASRHNRFGGGISDDFIRTYVESLSGANSVLHGFFVDGILRGAAELRPLVSTPDHDAEVAFSIEKPWQSHGVGTALLERTLLAARNRGYKLLHMACLADNRRMQQLARKFEAELTFDVDNVIGEVEAAHPTPLSVMREWVADSHGLATAMLDVQSRMLKS